MGKLVKNSDGTHSFIGGFSTKDSKDMKQLSDKFPIKGVDKVKPKKTTVRKTTVKKTVAKK